MFLVDRLLSMNHYTTRGRAWTLR